MTTVFWSVHLVGWSRNYILPSSFNNVLFVNVIRLLRTNLFHSKFYNDKRVLLSIQMGRCISSVFNFHNFEFNRDLTGSTFSLSHPLCVNMFVFHFVCMSTVFPSFLTAIAVLINSLVFPITQEYSRLVAKVTWIYSTHSLARSVARTWLPHSLQAATRLTVFLIDVRTTT